MAWEDLSDLEILVLCALYRRVGFAAGRKPANVTLDTVYSQLKHLSIPRREVRRALEGLVKRGLARPYEKRRTYTLTREGALLASRICTASWDKIRDRLKRG